MVDARARFVRRFGPEHFIVLHLQGVLARVLVEKGRLDDAEALTRETLAGDHIGCVPSESGSLSKRSVYEMLDRPRYGGLSSRGGRFLTRRGINVALRTGDNSRSSFVGEIGVAPLQQDCCLVAEAD